MSTPSAPSRLASVAALALAVAGLLGAPSPAAAATAADAPDPAFLRAVAQAPELSNTVLGQSATPLRPLLSECRKERGREDCRIALAVYFKAPVTGSAVVIDGKLASLNLRFGLDNLDYLLKQLNRAHGNPTSTTPFTNEYRDPAIRYAWDRTAVGVVQVETLAPPFRAGSLFVYDPTQLRMAEEENEDW